ncbi:MAG TPA: hypothetical protein VGB72_01090 [Acidobacteriota bacterium]
MGGGGGGRGAIARGGVSGGLAGLGPDTGPLEELIVRIISPKNNEIVFGKIEFRVEVSGGRGKINASVQLNGISIGKIDKRGASSISYDTIRKANGTYELKAKVSDAANSKETKPIHLIIKNRVH